jgi:hypothetical protein
MNENGSGFMTPPPSYTAVRTFSSGLLGTGRAVPGPAQVPIFWPLLSERER